MPERPPPDLRPVWYYTPRGPVPAAKCKDTRDVRWACREGDAEWTPIDRFHSRGT